MDKEKLAGKLRLLDATHAEQLAPRLVDEARSTPRAAVHLWLGQDESLSDKAQRLLGAFEDIVIGPLAAAYAQSPAERTWLLETMVAADLALRRRVATKIEKYLDDKRALPVALRGPVERPIPKRRVCDVAYLRMRELVHFGEFKEEALVQENLFLNAPVAFRDAQIKKARETATWNRAITNQDIEDYSKPK